MQKNKRGDSAILDDFYTKPELASKLLEDVRRITNKELSSWKQIIEPSAGGGSFFSLLPETNRQGYDICPTCDGIKKADFLHIGASCFSSSACDTLVIGNPPFGKNGSIALRFLNLCLKHANCVAFILPRSFEKESILSRIIPMTAHVIHQEILPLDSFIRNGNSHSIPTVFMIWRVLPNAPPRVYCSRMEHPDFEFIQHPIESEIRSQKLVMIQRVGQKAGRFTRNEDEMLLKHKSKNFYFLRSLAGPQVLECLRQLNLVESPSKYKTAGMPSIAKSDIVSSYIEFKKISET